MRRIAITLVLLLCAAGATSAQEPAKPEKLPTVDQLLEKYVTALGGKAAIEKVNTRVSKGNFELPAAGINASAEIYSKAPNKSAFVVDVPGFGIVKQAFNGSKGWAQDPASGLRDLSAAEIDALKRDEDLQQPLKFKQFYPKIEVKAKVKVGDRDTFLVEATPAGAAVEKFYFDTQSGLVIRMDAERETPQGKMAIEISFEDFREVDGLKVAHTIKQDSAALSFVIKLTEVKQNIPVDDAKFEKPASQ